MFNTQVSSPTLALPNLANQLSSILSTSLPATASSQTSLLSSLSSSLATLTQPSVFSSLNLDYLQQQEQAIQGLVDAIVQQGVDSKERTGWHWVEFTLGSLEILSKVRELSLRKAAESSTTALGDRLGRILCCMTYSCHIMVRFSRESNLTSKQSLVLKAKLLSIHQTYTSSLKYMTQGTPTNVGTQLISLIGLPANFTTVFKLTQGLLPILSLPAPPLGQLTSFLSAFCMAEWNVGTASTLTLGDLVLIDKVSMRYHNKPVPREAKVCLIRAAEKAISLFEPTTENVKPLDETIKMAVSILWQGENILEKLECLEHIKTSNFKELLKYKQSISNGSASDLLFDILLDLFRLSMPQTANNSMVTPSIALLNHKLNHPSVIQLLTPGVLSSLRHMIDSNGYFGYLLLFPPVLPQSLTLYLNTVAQWLLTLRNPSTHSSQLPTMLAEVDKGLAKAEESVKSTTDKSELLRCSYLMYYLSRYVPGAAGAQLALDNLARMFRHGEESSKLWAIHEDSGILFLDALDTAFQAGSDGCQVVEMIKMLAQPCSTDSDKVKALKALIWTKIDLKTKGDCQETVSKLPLLVQLALKTLPIEDVYSALKSELMRPEVYYLFFFRLIGYTIETNNVPSASNHQVLELLMSLHEDILKLQQISPSLLSPIPNLYKMLLPHLSPPISDRSWKLLFNQHIKTGDSEALALSVDYGCNDEILILWGLYTAQQNRVLERGQAEGMRVLNVAKVMAAKPEFSLVKSCEGQLRSKGKKMDVESQHRSCSMAATIEQELDDIEDLDIEDHVTLSVEQLYFLLFMYSHHFEPQKCQSLVESVSDSKEIFTVLFYAASLVSSPLYSSMLRTYLTQLLSSSSLSIPAVISVYTNLLGSTLSTRELRGYLSQLEGVFDLAKHTPVPNIKSLLLQLAKLKTDFGESLEAELKRIAKLLESKELCPPNDKIIKWLKGENNSIRIADGK